MSRQKMMPPSPLTDESENNRFKRFAKAILAVPKSVVSTETREAKMKSTVKNVLREPEPELHPEKAIVDRKVVKRRKQLRRKQP